MESNFEDKIKGLFDNPPELPVDENGWHTISQKLDTAALPPNERINWIWVPVAIGMLSLAGLAGYFFSQYKMTSERLVEMERILEEKNNATTKIIYDTIIQKEFIEVSNSNININQNHQKEGSNKIFDPSKMAPQKTTAQYFSTVENKNIGKVTQQVSSANTLYANNNTNQTLINSSLEAKEIVKTSRVEKFEKTSIEKKSFAFLQGKFIDAVASNQETPETVFDISYAALDLKRKKRRNNYLLAMKPQSFTLGVFAGTGIDQSLNFSDLEQTNYLYGVNAEIGFGNNWDLIIGSNYRSQRFEVEEEGDNQNNNGNLEGFPEVVPQDIDDELEEMSGQLNFLEIPIGFKYTFFTQKRIQPYVGLGFTSRKVLNSSIEYEFENNNTQGSNESYEIKKTNFLSSDFELKDAWGKVGLQMNVFRKWQFFMEGGYQSNWKNDGTSKLDDLKLLKANVGINYKF